MSHLHIKAEGTRVEAFVTEAREVGKETTKNSIKFQFNNHPLRLHQTCEFGRKK